MSLYVETPTRPDPPYPGRRPHRAAVVGAGVLIVLGLASAVTLPVVLKDRASSAATSLREQLQQVASAQSVWKTAHGSYTTQLSDLRMREPDGDLAIVRADDSGFCAGAFDEETRTALFYSAAAGFSSTACT
ncbi:hypothetical protein OG218_24970 [Kineococcus sp. NBC_00420]|uniref:hypothetical protein n=1 Tax=Kineococcus sp. NBC_00420 TaxID=2903564 RepID=UPI002E21D587